MRTILIAAAAALLAGATTSPASADCTCRAQGGIEAFLGETVCIATASGARLARCDMVLNNTSWTFLDSPCPQALLDQMSNTRTAAASHPHSHPVTP
jgi:hypothetical protein